LNHKMVAVNN